jgi:hypothetical protein
MYAADVPGARPRHDVQGRGEHGQRGGQESRLPPGQHEVDHAAHDAWSCRVGDTRSW